MVDLEELLDRIASGQDGLTTAVRNLATRDAGAVLAALLRRFARAEQVGWELAYALREAALFCKADHRMTDTAVWTAQLLRLIAAPALEARVRGLLVETLPTLARDDASALAPIVTHVDAALRAQLARGLAWAPRSLVAARTLLPLLTDADATVRKAAVPALGEMLERYGTNNHRDVPPELIAAAPELIPHLLTALDDADKDVRDQAAKALSNWRERAATALPVLLDRLERGGVTDVATHLRALGSVATSVSDAERDAARERALRVITPQLSEPWARSAFEEFAPSLETLIEMATAGDVHARRTSIGPLAQQASSGAPADRGRAFDALLRLADAPEGDVRGSALRSLGRARHVGGEWLDRAVTRLASALVDKESRDCRSAVFALADLAPHARAQVEPLLAPMLKVRGCDEYALMGLEHLDELSPDTIAHVVAVGQRGRTRELRDGCVALLKKLATRSVKLAATVTDVEAAALNRRKRSFYLLRHAVSPGGARKDRRWLLSDLEAVKKALLDDLTRDPYLAIVCAQTMALTIFRDSRPERTIDLRPYMRLHIPELGDIGFDKRGKLVGIDRRDKTLTARLRPGEPVPGLVVTVNWPAMELAPLGKPLLKTRETIRVREPDGDITTLRFGHNDVEYDGSDDDYDEDEDD